MGNDTEIVDDGPWRATRLWNSIIRNLQVKKSKFLTSTQQGDVHIKHFVQSLNNM